MINRTFCVAPMLALTDRHARYFLRLISQHVILYTEMVTTGALIYGNCQKYLQFNAEEHPVALQLGGSNPKEMAFCATMAENEGYDEVNINVGCPSNRVQKGSFGACLMMRPELVAECVTTMQNSVNIPITVKSRIGVDQQDSYQALVNFIQIIADAGCEVFIIHARKAWLQGLSPKENRHIPPLKYDWVYQIKQQFPHLQIIINGGITTLAASEQHLQHLDGVMVGRAAYHNPYLLAQIDRKFYGATTEIVSRKEIFTQYLDYVKIQLQQSVHLKHLSRHLLGLFYGLAGTKKWKQHISANAFKKNASIDVLKQAVELID